MKWLPTLITAGVLLAGRVVVQAQFSAPGGLPPGFHHALYDVLAGGPAFSGQATIQLSNGPDQEPTTITCNIAFLADKMRVEVDSFEAGTNVPPTEAAKLRNMRSVSILRQDRNQMYLLYPEFRCCVELASSKSTGTDTAPPPIINKNALGTEVVGSQTFGKSQWNITEQDGEHYDLTVWASTNLNNFPMQIRLGSPSALLVFQNLRLEAPDSALFDPPAGYMRYQGIPENILREAQKGRNTNAP